MDYNFFGFLKMHEHVPEIAITHLMQACSNMVKNYEEYINFILKREEIYGLHPNYALLLMCAPERPLPVGKWKFQTHLVDNNLTYILNKLKEMGYIKNVTCPEQSRDYRARFYQITDKGKKLVALLKEANACFLPEVYQRTFTDHSYKEFMHVSHNLSVQLKNVMYGCEEDIG